ncbi:ABC transporter substrate-binding protein [Actinomadura rugatobispora]|uniref:ABC transporter substrate-binding protein n=1 Tax=Actinomadura rugatobispora TaxID=1994 RepID=A0ABW1AJD9_9ACTN|nr:ABC transporter substrate-binding protein [Actinomadura rugatobispora]
MVPPTRRFPTAALAAAVALATAACSGSSAITTRGPAGDPVLGGTARVIMYSEPRSVDPAAMSNAWAFNAVLGNALYGTLMANDVQTGRIDYKMAESFTSDDNGRTFALTLRENLAFTDGGPLDAQAVKFNWDRLRNPATASSSIREAALIASTEVVDARTLKVTLRMPVPNYAHALVNGGMNWIASPKALAKGQRAFDAAPVGAGPFILKSWSRNDKFELVKNPRYWDPPKPYLDRIVLRATPDSMQRLSSLTSGGVDVSIDTSWKTIDKARKAGFPTQVMPLSGGQGVVMNTRRPPFDDLRARQAVAAALDLDAANLSVYNGKGKRADRLFERSSPFYTDIRLARQDRQLAQRLLDQLAGEGKRLSFTFSAQATSEAKGLSESLQTQLSAFRNVEVKIKTIDSADTSRIYAARDFDMVISSTMMVDPEPQLWANYHGRSTANMSGLNDPRLNAALDKGRLSTSLDERKAAYTVAQERLAALVPQIPVTRTAPAVETAGNVHGARMYGLGSLMPEELWMNR